ncbi:conserved hypothetical protein [Nitrospira lenta]|uniref:Uncharacterized protein n=1 Tax=Nitrospira lenta TaxID=1436998 RepID=A0A330L4R5_9BACT|nr:conserved hypothetical protein [Nitrospira lenta]
MTGFEFYVTIKPINKIKHLARQIEAKAGKKYANPQPAATRNLSLRTVLQIRRLLARSCRHEPTSRSPRSSTTRHPESSHLRAADALPQRA